MSTELLAFEVEIHSMRGIVFAETHAKARYIAALGYWEAGYCSRREWPRFTSKRIPRYDAHPWKNKGRRVWSPEFIEDTR